MNLKRAVDALREAGVPDPARDARRLFDWAYQAGQDAPEPQTADTPNDLTLAMFDTAINARLKRKPVSQIIGRRAFWRHEFEVTPDVLDPRPDTETLVAAALEQPFDRVLDLGTGSGCILLSLLADRDSAVGVGTDLSDAALAVARRNAARMGLQGRATFQQSDWFADLQGGFDLIVSNPPYIAADEMPGLQPEVRLHEPRMALTDDRDGLEAYRAIAADAQPHLLPEGRLMVEIGPTQAEVVSDIFEKAGLCVVAIRKDMDQRDRVILARP